MNSILKKYISDAVRRLKADEKELDKIGQTRLYQKARDIIRQGELNPPPLANCSGIKGYPEWELERLQKDAALS